MKVVVKIPSTIMIAAGNIIEINEMQLEALGDRVEVIEDDGKKLTKGK